MPNCDALYSASANLLPFIFEDDRNNFVKNLEKIRREKGETIIDVRMHVPGLLHLRWHRMHLKVIYHSGDDTIFLAAVEDISTAKTMELNFIKNEQRMQDMLETCSINSFDVNFENKTLLSDNLGKKMYGFPDVIKDAAETFINGGSIHEPNAAEIRSFFSDLFAGKPNSEIMLRCKNPDGTLHSAKLSYKTEFDGSNIPVSAVCVLRNIDVNSN
jgi:hypothetical protein